VFCLVYIVIFINLCSGSALSRWVVSFTLRPLYPQGKKPWHRLDRRLIIFVYNQWLLVMIFWFMMSCSNVAGYQCFRGPCCLDLMLKMEAAMSSKMMASHHITTRHQYPKNKLNNDFGSLISWTINLPSRFSCPVHVSQFKFTKMAEFMIHYFRTVRKMRAW
jgi:hypothetical protein